MERNGLTPGSEIGGYTVVAPLGAGGMGTVYRAHDDGGGAVALKLLHAQVEADATARARLAREVAALQRLRHPAVAQVLDAELDGADAFLVTELVEGRDLQTQVEEEGALGADALLALASGLRDALEAVHAAGVVHRDLKPSNIVMTEQGPVLIDFGLAHGTEDSTVTSTGLVMGTPGYLAPEILDGDEPGESADWWGWAAVLAFAATGRPPFGKGRAATVMTRSRAGKPDLVGLGRLTRAAIRGALVPAPDERTSPEDVVAALTVVAAEGDLMPRPRKPRAAAAAATTVVDRTGDGTTVLDGAPDGAPEAAAGATVAATIAAPAPPAAPPAAPATVPMPSEQWYDDTWDDDRPYYGEDDEYAAVEWIEGDLDASAGPPVEGSGYLRPRVPGRWVTQLALAGLVFVCGARWPGRTLVVALALMFVARAFGVAVEATYARREKRGVRGSDWWLAALATPWHLVRAAIGLVPAVLIAAVAVVIICGGAWWLVSETRWVIGDNQPGDELAGRTAQLLVGGVVLLGVLLVWFGPASRMTRVGARRLLEAASPRRLGALAAIVAITAAALWIGRPLWDGSTMDWSPLPVPVVPVEPREAGVGGGAGLADGLGV